jgi:V8-like Glu-specific endopeptidase
MKAILFALVLVSSFAASPSFSSPKVVYGTDDRTDLFHVTNPVYLKAARASAAMMANFKVANEVDGLIKLDTLPYGPTCKLCTDEKFYKQSMAANCSGFLVAKDLIVTAGHCMTSPEFCSRYSWVFDFQVSSDEQSEYLIPKNSVYHCKEIVESKQDTGDHLDYAVIRLDRPVTDREPVKVRRDLNTVPGTKVVLAGYPNGLPLKLAEGLLQETNLNYYRSNVDSFVLNSGSLIFNAITGEAEGILVGGMHDYTYDGAAGCFRTFKLTDGYGSGAERVTRIQRLLHLIPRT